MTAPKISKSLLEAKGLLLAKWNDGCLCPVCGQTVKLYTRKLNHGMTVFLIALYKLDRSGQKYIHVKDVLGSLGQYTKSLDYSVLEHFGLIRKKIETTDDKRSSGFWKITLKGTDFVKVKIRILSKVKIYNNKFYGLTGQRVNVVEALGTKFDYKELMAS